MQKINYLLTPGGIHMVLDKKPVDVARTDTVFEKVIEAVKANASETEILEILNSEKLRVEKAVTVTESITVREGVVYFDGKQIAGVLCDRLLQMLDEGFDLKPMENFLRLLYKNPSRRVIEHLYAFLEYGKSPITEDGHFLAYKAVRKDFKDIHSGSFDNSVGSVLEMERNAVDDDPQKTCSYGFHVCSFDYLPHFSHADGHVMICKVSPADVVAIPVDYRNTKMRVRRYEVIDEYEGYYTEREDILRKSSVANLEGKTFVVYVDYQGFEDFQAYSAFNSLSEAASEAESLACQSNVAAVRITNAFTEQTVLVLENEDFEDGGALDDDEVSYSVYGVDNGCKTRLSGGHGTVKDAMESAIEFVDDYDEVQIVDDFDDSLVKTIT